MAHCPNAALSFTASGALCGVISLQLTHIIYIYIGSAGAWHCINPQILFFLSNPLPVSPTWEQHQIIRNSWTAVMSETCRTTSHDWHNDKVKGRSLFQKLLKDSICFQCSLLYKSWKKITGVTRNRRTFWEESVCFWSLSYLCVATVRGLWSLSRAACVVT